MPLVKGGEVTADRYLRIVDDAPVPASGAVLVPAERFLADAAEFARRQGETGVIWPNNRDIDELAPHLDQLSLVALVFPKFQDGRAYSQARILRERLGFRGELRATGQVLRDQFVFMLRAGFDAFEVKKDADAKVFGAVTTRYSVFYQPTGDGRLTAFRRRLQGFVAREPRAEGRQPMTFLDSAQRASVASVEAAAVALDRDLTHASPTEIVQSALRTIGREKLAVVSSFGTESAALLKIVADVDPAIPVVFLDTGWLFQETLDYRDQLTQLLGLRDVRTIKPLAAALEREDANSDLWFSNPDACCHIRKVEPLARALEPFSGWFNGRKRFQGGDRANIAVVEADGARLKFNPLANATAKALKALYASAKLPPHPLLASGFTSIGCMPCTTRTKPGEDPRAGRWRERGKTECGIHVAKVS